MINILVIHNCSLFRFGIHALFETDSSIEVFTEQTLSCLTDAQYQRGHQLDVLVISSRSSKLTLPGIIGKLRQCFPTTNILVLLDYQDEIYIKQLVEDGITANGLGQISSSL